MRVIIAGPRDLEMTTTQIEDLVVESGFVVTLLVCGMATGIDMSAWHWADLKEIPKDEHPVTKQQWSKLGGAAGPMRNKRMAEVADALIAVDRGSRGTRSMISIARAKGLKVFVKEWK